MSTTTLQPPRPDQVAAAPKGRSRMVLVLLLVLLLAGGAGAWFFLKPAGDGKPVPGEVLALESIQVNLADGHYLSVGVAMQLVDGAHDIDGSKALDATIDMFSGRPVAELADAGTRRTLKAELGHTIAELYHEEVLEVYFTQFVTQ